MSTERATRALERTLKSCRRVDAAAERLDAALGTSNGVPIRPIDSDDSLAVSLEGAHGEALLHTSRSRRAVRGR